MANNLQAPILRARGKEIWEQNGKCPYGKLIIDNEIVYAVYKATADKSKTQFGIMMFLLGSAQDGRFSVPHKTVENRMGIKENTYYKNLKDLADIGLIEWKRGSDIVICYDKLWELVSADSTDVEYRSNNSTGEEYLTSVESESVNSTDEEYSTLIESLRDDSTDVQKNNINDSTDVKSDDWLKVF